MKNYLRRTVKKSDIVFTEHRPWTLHSKIENPHYKKARPIYVEPIKDWMIFKGDRVSNTYISSYRFKIFSSIRFFQVEILYGHDKGKQGIINQIIQERNWVFVEGLNKKIKVHEKETHSKPAVIRHEEQPLRVTEHVALVDPSDLYVQKKYFLISFDVQVIVFPLN